MDDKLIKMIRLHEGVEHFAYNDSLGFVTIGVGRNIDSRGGRGLSDDEIDYLLSNDIKEAKIALYDNVPAFKHLSKVRQAVLIDMYHNLGLSGLLRFKKTLAYISLENFEEASKEMLRSKWASQVGKRAIRLSNMMASGKWYLV